jgi:methyltransferase (TIGR00027 family)
VNLLTKKPTKPNGVPQADWTSSLDLSIYYKPLQLVPDEEDLLIHQANSTLGPLNQRIHELLPLLGFTNCTIEHVSEDMTVGTAPLLEAAMNQNGTQQAAVFYLVADWILAVGIFGALPGIYCTGFHNRCHALPVQIWTKQGTVHHHAPGTGEIRAAVRMAPEKRTALRQALINKGRAECCETVYMYQGEQLVATAEITVGIYADLPRAPGARASILQAQNLKLSALLIAGLRADPISQMIAQEQGRAIAHRMTVATPQLPSLIQARTAHIEGYLCHAGKDHAQVVVLGIGLDTKAFRFARSDQQWYGLDLPSMVKERSRLLAKAGVRSNYLGLVDADVRTDKWMAQLQAAGYDERLSTLFILEGLSMYLSLNDLQLLLRQIRSANTHALTRVWLDHVSTTLYTSDLVEVQAYLQAMTRLGEPFISGFDDARIVGAPEWQVRITVSAADFLHINEPVHSMYIFSLLQRNELCPRPHSDL